MQFLSSLFGGTGSSVAGVIFALGLVLVLIVLSVWALKFVFQASDHVARGRARRLALVEAVPLDGKRQLLIVRRDNVEHVILTGGPQDLVLESGIPAEKPLVQRPAVVAHAPAAGHGKAANVPLEQPAPADAAAVPAAASAIPPLPRPERPFAVRGTSGAVERLRAFTGPAGPISRASRSLRHTGLMRPSSLREVIPGYLDEPAPDSAKTTVVAETKGTDGAVARDGVKAGSIQP